MADYTEFLNLALELIAADGYDAVIRRKGRYDFNTDVQVDGGEWPCKALNSHEVVEKLVRGGGKGGDGTLILSTDLGVLIPAQGVDVVPAFGDEFVAPGGTYAVQRVTVTAPGGTPILYEMVAR